MTEAIAEAKHIILITHLNPDADAMGAACAMYAYLLRLHKKITLFCASETIDPALRACIPWAQECTNRWNASADLAISFDCGSYERLGVKPEMPLVNIDHHASNEGYGSINLVDHHAVSTASVLLQWFDEQGIVLNVKMATALYAGLAHDTMGFIGERTSPETFETVARLVRSGAMVSEVNRMLFMHSSLAALRLKSRLLGSMQLFGDGRIVVLAATREDFEATGAAAFESDAAFQNAMHLPTVEVGLLMRESNAGTLHVSLRSDNGMDVGTLAERFGGGGHTYAAGFVAEAAQWPELRNRLLDQIKEALDGA